jgi:hypothetical protein
MGSWPATSYLLDHRRHSFSPLPAASAEPPDHRHRRPRAREQAITSFFAAMSP